MLVPAPHESKSAKLTNALRSGLSMKLHTHGTANIYSTYSHGTQKTHSFHHLFLTYLSFKSQYTVTSTEGL